MKNKELTTDDVLKALHAMIDKKFGRVKRGKFVSPHLLKSKMTLWSISGEFMDYEPELIAPLLKDLVKQGVVESNIESTYPLDAYFIPKSELMDEKLYDTYAYVKKKVLS